MLERRRKIGAEVIDGGVHFRVWAPGRKRMTVVLANGEHELTGDEHGYFSALIEGIGAGAPYRFRIDDAEGTVPDPASRYQPDGPHGDSIVIDPSTFRWSDASWRGADRRGAVLYELHAGTFTREGTWRAAIDKLPLLASIGITTIEVMPVAEFAGNFGWGYDGVALFAPSHLYGAPDDFRAFVDAAHAHDLGVILDVVYNHFGPDGCYLEHFTPHYFTTKYQNDWGKPLNFDGEESDGVREHFIENAAYWIDEFHLDGLRLDATQSIFDASPDHILAALLRNARSTIRNRKLYFIAENEPQDVRLIEDYGVDAMWNDDWHHSALVATIGHSEAYYTDYRGRAQEFVSMAKHGFLFQGQRYRWQKQRRGTPSLGMSADRFVCYLQNHDQLANSARGLRLQFLTSPAQLRAATALLLLQPQTPLLFQGQEFAASAPFLYFADHKPELATAVAKGRREFLAQFPTMATREIVAQLARPEDPATFEVCKLDFEEWDEHAEIVALHRDLIALRKNEPAFAQQNAKQLDGAALSDDAFVLRFFHADGDRLLLVNFGSDLRLDPAPEPLLAPERGRVWDVLWSSEAPRYSGSGTAPLETEENWRIPGHAAVVMRGRPCGQTPDATDSARP